MKSEEFIDIIGDIEEEYLLKAREERKIKKVIPMKKAFALAAALIILGATATAVIASVMGAEYKQSYDVSLINGFGREMEGKGYTIELDLIPVPIESLNIKPDEDHYYSNLEHEVFYRASEAVDYIGCKRIEMPDLGLHCGVNWVMVEKEDFINPNYACIASHHQGDGIEIETKAHIIIGEETEESVVYSDSFEAGGLNGKDIVYTSEYFTNVNDISYLVVKSSVVEDYHIEVLDKNQFENVIYINAYLVKNGVAYSFSAEEKTVYDKTDPEATKLYEEQIYKPENNAKIEKYLQLWADSF